MYVPVVCEPATPSQNKSLETKSTAPPVVGAYHGTKIQTVFPALLAAGGKMSSADPLAIMATRIVELEGQLSDAQYKCWCLEQMVDASADAILKLLAAKEEISPN